MIQYRKLTKEDKDDLRNVFNIVMESLERKEFFIPFTEETLDDRLSGTKIISYGAYDNEKLVGTAQLYVDEKYYSNLKEIIGLKSDKVAELGGYLVLSDYRGKGIMKKLENILLDEAKKLGCEYILVTAHPENIPSNKAIQFTGAKIVHTTYLGEYWRNIYLLDLKNNDKKVD